MSFARQKLIAAACALGLGLSVVAQAAGQPAEGHAEKRADARHGQRSELAMLERPRKRFAQSVELARRKAERARKARASDTARRGVGRLPLPGVLRRIERHARVDRRMRVGGRPGSGLG